MLLAISGTKGSAGVTTFAYALTRHWTPSRSAVFLEADPDGGVVAARLGLSEDPGLSTLAAAAGREVEPPAWQGQTQRVRGGPPVLVLPSAPGHARAVLRTVAEGLVGSVALDVVGDGDPVRPSGRGGPGVVVADVGRLSGESPSLPFVLAAARVAVVTTPTLEGADAAAVRIAELPDLRDRVDLVTVGEGPYGGEELARVLSVRHLGHLPESRTAVRSVWAGRRRSRWRGPYGRAVSSIAARVSGGDEPAIDPASFELQGSFGLPGNAPAATS